MSSLIMPGLDSVVISGREVFPIVEGGKGVAVSDSSSSGAFAAADAVGTISLVSPTMIDIDGNTLFKKREYRSSTRRERFYETIQHSIDAGINQIKRAYDLSGGKGRLHVNILWELGGAEKILEGVLSKVSDLISGVTCGAGMPYNLAPIAAKYKVHYIPIVSSARAFKILWKRSYRKFSNLLSGVVYEDPWRAGGHNGISNKENPLVPEDPIPRIGEIREFMNEEGLGNVPLIMAGGVWYLKDWVNIVAEKKLGPIAYQFGTRPLLTKESPISLNWKRRLVSLNKGDIVLNKFSPTGFYSSAVKNDFLNELYARSDRQVMFSRSQTGETPACIELGVRKRKFFFAEQSIELINKWRNEGFTSHMITPDNTMIFVTEDQEKQILKDQIDCMGCLSHCNFSNWKDHDDHTTGKKADPRSFCIHKTLRDIVSSVDEDSLNNNLMFCGTIGYMFAEDDFYDDFRRTLDEKDIPSVKDLVQRIMTGL